MRRIPHTLQQHTGAILFLAVVVAALMVRIPGLGSFMTADEQNWMLRSAEFWHTLLQGNPGGTFITTHPGAGAMWLIGAGVVVQEGRLQQTIDEGNLYQFRVAAVLPVAVASAVLVAGITFLAYRLGNLATGVATGAFLVLDPYITGMSMIAHLDALLALSMFLSVLSFLCFLKYTQYRWLIVTGVAAGFAMATKLLPSLWLWIFFGFALALHVHGRLWVTRRFSIRSVFFTFGVAALAFFMMWPALWAKQDISRSIERDIAGIAQDAHVSVGETEKVADRYSFFYVRTLLSRSTPLIQLASIGAVILMLLMLRQRLISSFEFLLPWYVWGYGVGFVILITFAAKQGDRYALPALVALTGLAGWAIGQLPLRRAWQQRTLYVLVGSGMLAIFVQWSPYAIAYTNPVFDLLPGSQQGWGEGLDAAARYLNDHPLGSEAYVASWYPSVLGTYYQGKTLSLSSRDDDRVAFVVLYRNMRDRGDDVATDILREYEHREPLHEVTINGQPYAWVYETIGMPYFPDRTDEVAGDVEVGQIIPISDDGWRGVEVGLVNFSGRPNTHDVILQIKEQPDGPALRTVTVNAQEISDATYHTFSFTPIENSAGKNYFVSLTSPTSVTGDAIAVRFRRTDLLPGRMWLRRRSLQAGETIERFLREGDIAYRLHF